jgi:hypothetical protein
MKKRLYLKTADRNTIDKNGNNAQNGTCQGIPVAPATIGKDIIYASVQPTTSGMVNFLTLFNIINYH